MFLYTVMCGQRAYDWNTIAKPPADPDRHPPSVRMADEPYPAGIDLGSYREVIERDANVMECRSEPFAVLKPKRTDRVHQGCERQGSENYSLTSP